MMKDLYLDGEYAEKNPKYHVEDSSWKAQQILKMLDRHHLSITSVCEVGCGAGEILRQLQFHMPEKTVFFGYEISPQAFELCKQRANEKLIFRLLDLLTEEIQQPYDLLLCIDVFEHVENYMGFLRKLKPKGDYKIFHIPLEISVQTVLRGSPFLLTRAKVGHLHYYMKDTAILTLIDTGYEILDYFYTPASLDRGTTFKSKLLKLPRILGYSLLGPDLTARILGGYSLMVLAR
jgi:2-polyprenyl-3-methyl-5-hydroxy-6-metoxy-1,4-benzoquinol methylase